MIKYLLVLILIIAVSGCDCHTEQWVILDKKANVKLDWAPSKSDCEFWKGVIIRKNIFYTEHYDRLECVKEISDD